MRATTMLIAGLAVLVLIAAGTAIWLQSRPLGLPTAEQFKQIRGAGSLIAMADSMACPPEMASRRMKLAEAKDAYARLRARFAFTADQSADLDRSIADFRDIGKHVRATAEKCNQMGPRFLDQAIIQMGRF